MSEKLITILTSIYNKAPYLETWAFSVASQTYLDKARIIVTDDGSTDDSLAQLKKCVAKYNLPIELYLHEKNMGILRTLLEFYSMIETKYFTVFDADDYWLSPYRLERAVNFFETHDDFSMYASNSLYVTDSGKMTLAMPLDFPSQTITSLRKLPMVQTSAAVFRNFFTPNFLKWTVDAAKKYPAALTSGDSFRDVFALKFGKYYFDNSVDTGYRCTIGVWGGLSEIEKSVLLEAEYLELFKLYYIAFGLDDNAIKLLYDAIEYHKKNVQKITALTQDGANFDNFKVGKYTKENLEHYSPGSDGVALLCDVMLSHEKFLEELDA